jgi:hypothetical protein
MFFYLCDDYNVFQSLKQDINRLISRPLKVAAGTPRLREKSKNSRACNETEKRV